MRTSEPQTEERRAPMGTLVESALMSLYSLALLLVFLTGSPFWLVRMATGGRYRAGLGSRLGRVPRELRSAVAGKRVVWLHAVSVGEVLAATRLVQELEAALAREAGDGQPWIIVVSTTTATGQALARERFGADRVFWYPLDFAWAVRAYLRALQPRLLILMESELWPRMLLECGRRGVRVAVGNARVSDRSFARGLKLRPVWGWVLRRVTFFLAQSDEDARRLTAMGARASAVRATGNLKYDIRAPTHSRMAELIRQAAAGRPILVAGSTAGGADGDEETAVLEAWTAGLRPTPSPLLVIGPRHPQRFAAVEAMLKAFAYQKASAWNTAVVAPEVVLLDTIGDLASVYALATVAFLGGSLVPKGGHNPLEPAQFGVPVVMGPYYANFRDVVNAMKAAQGIRIVDSRGDLTESLTELFADADKARAMGERGRRVYEQQQGATARTVTALLALVRS